MTTREQLGLNANWIPMDSSKSGGSDEFLVKKVNQLESKVTELKDSTFFSILSPNEETTKFTAWVKDKKYINTRKLVVGLVNARENVRVKFKLGSEELDTRSEFIELGYRETYEIPINEITSELQARYGIHVYTAEISINTVKISGTANFTVEVNPDQLSDTGFTESTYNRSTGVSKLKKSYKIIDDSVYTSVKLVERNTELPESEKFTAQDIIISNKEQNQFQVLANKPSKSTIYLLRKYKIGMTGNTIFHTSKIQILEHFGDDRWVESEIVWRSPTDQLKEKLKPLTVTNNMSNGGVDSNYGYMGNKSGRVIYPYAPSVNGCLSYAYRTDCGEWLGYFVDDESAKFIKNADKVPSYRGLPFSNSTNVYNEQWTEYPKLFPSMGDDAYSKYGIYARETLKDLKNLANEQMPAINSLRYRCHVGLVYGDFNNSQTYEVWSFVPSLANNNANISTSMLSSLVDSTTGNFRTSYSQYELWKNSQCVIHQTLAKEGDSIIVRAVELTTIDKFFQNFIAKSNEWMAKNPDKVENGTPKGNYDRRYVWGGVYDRL